MDWAAAFWRCRWLWPGDSDFSPERFGDLNCRYVVDAIEGGQKLRREELHQNELPVANLASLTANLNRDPESKSKPFTAQDFSFFDEQEERNDGPDSTMAAAYMSLVNARALPRWALFCFTQMEQSAKGGKLPHQVAAQADGVLLLGPRFAGDALCGLLIADHSASGTKVKLEVEDQEYVILIPTFSEQSIAREGERLPIIG